MEETVQLWPPRPLQSKKLRCLAPMVRANSTPLRILALDYGADVVYSEELIARRLELCTRKENEELKTIDFVDASGKTTSLRVDPVREKNRLVVQLGAASLVMRPEHIKPSRVKPGCYALLGFVALQPFMYGQARDVDFM